MQLEYIIMKFNIVTVNSYFVWCMQLQYIIICMNIVMVNIYFNDEYINLYFCNILIYSFVLIDRIFIIKFLRKNVYCYRIYF